MEETLVSGFDAVQISRESILTEPEVHKLDAMLGLRFNGFMPYAIHLANNGFSVMVICHAIPLICAAIETNDLKEVTRKLSEMSANQIVREYGNSLGGVCVALSELKEGRKGRWSDPIKETVNGN